MRTRLHSSVFPQRGEEALQEPQTIGFVPLIPKPDTSPNDTATSSESLFDVEVQEDTSWGPSAVQMCGNLEHIPLRCLDRH